MLVGEATTLPIEGPDLKHKGKVEDNKGSHRGEIGKGRLDDKETGRDSRRDFDGDRTVGGKRAVGEDFLSHFFLWDGGRMGPTKVEILGRE